MLNYIWLTLVMLAVAIGGWNNQLKEVTDGAFDGARTAVTIALGLIGIMAMWLGLMRLAERAGLIQRIARALRPIMRRLFPDVPAEHPAMGSMLMNMAANMLGLGNAATPLGLRAMRDLEALNRQPGTATNAMCTFLALNTSSVQLIPTTAIAILAAEGSTRPTAIVGTALLATLCAATTAIVSVKLLEKLPFFRMSPGDHPTTKSTRVEPDAPLEVIPPSPTTRPRWWASALLLVLVVFFAALFARMVFPALFHQALGSNENSQAFSCAVSTPSRFSPSRFC